MEAATVSLLSMLLTNLTGFTVKHYFHTTFQQRTSLLLNVLNILLNYYLQIAYTNEKLKFATWKSFES